MFGTLLGALPAPALAGGGDAPAARLDALVSRAIEAQATAGLEPITDGRLRWTDELGPFATWRPGETGTGPLLVAEWRFAARATERAVKQALPGPYTLGRRAAGPTPADRGRDRITMAAAAALREEILALAEAGCPIVEVEERDAPLIGTDEAERRLFRAAHAALTDGIAGIHLSLAITGGNADAAGIETILGAPYPSLALDVIDGPDNWRLVRGAPGDRGIVCGALSTRAGSDDGPELLLWAAGYAASSNGRGPDRVGLATAGSLAHLTWDVAVRKLERLGAAVRLAQRPKQEVAAAVDPRALDLRSAAAGRYVRRARPRPPAKPPTEPDGAG